MSDQPTARAWRRTAFALWCLMLLSTGLIAYFTGWRCVLAGLPIAVLAAHYGYAFARSEHR